MLGTWAEGVAAAAGAGVRVHEMDGTMRCVPVRAVADPVRAPPAHAVLLLVKSYQTDRAATWAAQVLAPDGLAVTLQNGLDNGSRLAGAVGAARTVVGVTFEAATLLGPAEVRHAGRGPTLLGSGAGAVPVPHASGLHGPVAPASGLRSAEHKPEACVTAASAAPVAQASGLRLRRRPLIGQ
jgi:ketopantoate reductase